MTTNLYICDIHFYPEISNTGTTTNGSKITNFVNIFNTDDSSQGEFTTCKTQVNVNF